MRKDVMRLEIKGLAELRARLERLRPADIMAAALAAEADRLAQSVRDGLATPPGAGNHDRPWAKTGALHDSIAVTSENLEASVGSSDPAAAPQEMGTARIPPRPFLAPVAATNGEQIARTIGARVAAALSEGANADIIAASSAGTDTGAALLGALLLGGAYVALKGSSSSPIGPTRPAPLMNQARPKDEAQQEEAAPTKPEYGPNAAHSRRSSRYNPNKDAEPSDAEETYQNAEPDLGPDSRRWFGQNRNGQWYQYYEDRTGSAHYAGTVREGKVPVSIRRARNR